MFKVLSRLRAATFFRYKVLSLYNKKINERVSSIHDYVSVNYCHGYIRGYGNESRDLVHHAKQGEFKGVDPEIVENCAVCHDIENSQDAYGHNEDLEPWISSWIALHESDKDVQYENELLTITGHFPYSSCGPYCCHDNAKTIDELLEDNA